MFQLAALGFITGNEKATQIYKLVTTLRVGAEIYERLTAPSDIDKLKVV